MKVGHVFTVEPVLAEANAEATKWPDGWTYATIDGSWTAQFEHTPGPTDPHRSPKPPPVFSEGSRSSRIFFSAMRMRQRILDFFWRSKFPCSCQ